MHILGIFRNKFVKQLITLLLLTMLAVCSPSSLAGSTTSTPDTTDTGSGTALDWMGTALSALAGLFSSCLEVPEFTSYRDGSTTLNLQEAGKWIPTGTSVSEGKLLKFEWDTLGLTTRPNKYLVMYRIDPRFPNPQLFIQQYDYNSDSYISDFHNDLYNANLGLGELMQYQLRPDLYFPQRLTEYQLFFNYELSRIAVNKGDVVNITLVDSGSFFAHNSNFAFELDSDTDDLTIIFTPTFGMDNKILYADASVWCNALTPVQGNNSLVCSNNTYQNSWNPYSIVVGKSREIRFTNIMNNLPSCPNGLATSTLTSLCLYDKGRGMRVSVGNVQLKTEVESFVHSDFLNRDFLYYEADSSGSLTFSSNWGASPMFSSFFPVMTSWILFPSFDDIVNYVNNAAPAANYMYMGRYIMTVEVGNGQTGVSLNIFNNITLEYTISSSYPDSTTTGQPITPTTNINAPASGDLWVRVVNTGPNISGTVNLKYTSYSGNTWFSDIIYNKAILPLQQSFSNLTKLFYTALSTDPSLQKAGRLMLTLYILLYGLYYLAGATQITVTDLVIRVVKIAVIVALFSPTSWNFFNDNLFQMFVGGTDYLLNSVIGVTSSVGNIFGFIDPIFNKYTNPKIWALLFIQLLMIYNGLTFFAIMTIYSIVLYFRAVLEVIISYIMAFIIISVMISLAPIFITFMLFSQTKSIFDNWLSVLFNYMIQPTILMIFFLLIDQLINAQITKSILPACWGWLIPIEIGLDLSALGIPIDFSFQLPFLPGIPFFITQVDNPSNVGEIIQSQSSFIIVARTALLFYAYCLMAHGLVEYLNMVVMQLTNVTPARQEGVIQRGAGAGGSIKGDLSKLASPVTGSAKFAGSTFKDKVIDQNYRARPAPKTSGKPTEYAEKIKSGPRKDV
jgi:type IV secretion system protein VirB6